jgi:hypothetical protein
MKQKNLTTQMNNSANRLIIEDLSAEMVELSDEVLSQVCGGQANHKVIPLQHLNFIDAPDPATIHPELLDNPMITPETNPEFYHPALFA